MQADLASYCAEMLQNCEEANRHGAQLHSNAASPPSISSTFSIFFHHVCYLMKHHPVSLCEIDKSANEYALMSQFRMQYCDALLFVRYRFITNDIIISTAYLPQFFPHYEALLFRIRSKKPRLLAINDVCCCTAKRHSAVLYVSQYTFFSM